MLVAEAGELGLGELGDVGAVVENAAAVGSVEGADNLQQGGLSGARGTHNRHHLALVDGEVDVAQHMQRSVRLVDVLDFYQEVYCFAMRKRWLST